MSGTEQFKAQARDRDGEWVVMMTGSPQEARTRVVREAGSMTATGYVVVGMNRQGITVQDPDDPRKQTEFRISKVVERRSGPAGV